MQSINKPSGAFVLASWVAMSVGMGAFLIGLWNASMEVNQKGYFFTLLLLGLFSAVSLQKSVRDRLEEIPVSDAYLMICWFSFLSALVLLSVGLWNASMELNEKGFYAISFFLSLYASIVVQKNIRDTLNFSSTETKVELECVEKGLL